MFIENKISCHFDTAKSITVATMNLCTNECQGLAPPTSSPCIRDRCRAGDCRRCGPANVGHVYRGVDQYCTQHYLDNLPVTGVSTEPADSHTCIVCMTIEPSTRERMPRQGFEPDTNPRFARISVGRIPSVRASLPRKTRSL